MVTRSGGQRREDESPEFVEAEMDGHPALRKPQQHVKPL